MSKLNWFIDEECFAAHTEFGTYRLGDWGGGKGNLHIPGKPSQIVAFAEGKDIAQADFAARRTGSGAY